MQSGTYECSSQVEMSCRPGLIMRIRQRLARWQRERRNRVALAQLLEHDDRLLKDIGVTRAELVVALDKPSPRDAAIYLTHNRRCKGL
ncbi:MAG: DUF1127 domain-containing protein [Hyphomicrobiaceae bacterium]